MADSPTLAAIGTDGYIVRFATVLDDRANRALQGFATALEAAALEGVCEISMALASVLVRFDRSVVKRAEFETNLAQFVSSKDWYAEQDEGSGRLWRIPTLWGGEAGPQLNEAARLVGMSETAAAKELSQTELRVLAIGFAPGQPYLGMLPEAWDIPRQTELTPRVPRGALVLAVRQICLFANETPTGWRHVGQTHMQIFRPEAEAPFALRPGDRLRFPAVSEHDFALLETDPLGGAKLTERAGA